MPINWKDLEKKLLRETSNRFMTEGTMTTTKVNGLIDICEYQRDLSEIPWLDFEILKMQAPYAYPQLKLCLLKHYKTTLFETEQRRYSKTPKKKLMNVLKEICNTEKLYKLRTSLRSSSDDEESIIYVSQDFLIICDYHDKNYYINITSIRENICKLVNEVAAKNGYSKAKEKPELILLGMKKGEIKYQYLENIESSFYKDHYNDPVSNSRDRISKDLNNKSPIGRIVLIDGTPGTGKTHLIRSLIQDNAKCLYVFIPPNMVSSLTGPDLISVLTDLASKGQTIVLVIEDGDHCLLPRGPDNISSISSLLNVTDGIIGCSLDIRAIITTNAKIHSIDSAIMRPGRLSEQLSIEKLTKEKAQVLYKKLSKDELADYQDEDTTLAAIYARSKDINYTNKNKEEVQPKKAMGFG